MAAIPVAVTFPKSTVITNVGRIAFQPGESDFTVSQFGRSISGHVYDANGVAVQGATVALFRQRDNYMCATTTSLANGIYTFQRDRRDPEIYYTLAYSLSGGVVQIHGVSNRGLVPV